MARMVDRIVNNEPGRGGSSRTRWSRCATGWRNAYGRSVGSAKHAVGRPQFLPKQFREQQHHQQFKPDLQRSRFLRDAGVDGDGCRWNAIDRTRFLLDELNSRHSNPGPRIRARKIPSRSRMRATQKRQITQRSRPQDRGYSDALHRQNYISKLVIERDPLPDHSTQWRPHCRPARIPRDQTTPGALDTGLCDRSGILRFRIGN